MNFTENATEFATLLAWQHDQSHIVTGDGQILLFSEVNKDFLPTDLPHYLLENKTWESTFSHWLNENKRSELLIGCWSRPIFAGGWKESSDADTTVFNLQTPSFFIDLRIPNTRPSELFRSACLSNYSNLQLRLLSRQHCFAGYSLMQSAGDIATERSYYLPASTPVCTRHHIIDWNYHPWFPRSRPNRWFAEVKADQMAFREVSPFRNANLVPVYFERWQRRTPYELQQDKYLAMLREDGGAVLVVVGRHFALCVDRPSHQTATLSHEEVTTHCKGGGGMFVDYLLSGMEECGAEAQRGRRRLAEVCVSLEGSYGLVQDGANWTILKSTFPWLEGHTLFEAGDWLELQIGNAPSHFDTLSGPAVLTASWNNVEHTAHPHGGCLRKWDIVENSFSIEELHDIFPTKMKMK